MKPVLLLVRALQDYNNKAPDSELVTAPCLHGYSSLMVDIAILAHKAYQYIIYDKSPRDTLGV